MITFVDTNVLLDVFLPDPKWGQKSKIRLEQAFDQGSLILNEIIYSELTPQFSSKALLDDALKILSIRIVSLDLKAAYNAGRIWKDYRKAGGRRNRILAGFFNRCSCRNTGGSAPDKRSRLLQKILFESSYHLLNPIIYIASLPFLVGYRSLAG